MKDRILFLLKYFISWLCAFVIARLVFLIYQYGQSFDLSARTWLKIFSHGFKLDLSMTGYITLFPALVLLVTSFFRNKPACIIINAYTFIVILVFLLITLVDLEAYKYWGTRLDSAPLRFLNKPKEVLASSSILTLIAYFTAFIAFTVLIFIFYRKYISSSLANSTKAGMKAFIPLVFIVGLLIIPIRGGLGVSPVNTGSVYFSSNSFANHAAVNVMWNFGQSVVENKETRNPYVFHKEKNYESVLLDLYRSGTPDSILKIKRPNIILLILESFSAKLIEPLGGTPNITPKFNEMSKHGVLFSQLYSTDSRTDKGVATVISGYPVLEAIPIMKYSEKTQNLAFLSKALIDAGYHTSFLYGGDVDFANMRSYFVNGGFQKITSESDFPASVRTGKWGVPDHYVYNRFLEDIKADTGTWFKVMLTLSNHEPFEIPGKPKFGDKTLTEKFYSSAFYADSCLGDFIRRFRESGQWDNTLIIMVADHGTRLPEFDEVFEPRKHHIPLLFTGGAVATDTVVSKIGSQANIAYTLLHQLGLPAENFLLGKDLLSPESKSFAFYSIKNGIAMITDSSGFGYDFVEHGLNYSYGNIDSSLIDIAKTMQQYVFDNYLNLSQKR
ncbi:MAG TPA: sulfatase-like hydrolase/transferase [Bacteroidales bacterium]|nr:sulfatase-like hydrolase/transferase [Bacteroidales bacterium]